MWLTSLKHISERHYFDMHYEFKLGIIHKIIDYLNEFISVHFAGNKILFFCVLFRKRTRWNFLIRNFTLRGPSKNFVCGFSQINPSRSCKCCHQILYPFYAIFKEVGYWYHVYELICIIMMDIVTYFNILIIWACAKSELPNCVILLINNNLKFCRFYENQVKNHRKNFTFITLIFNKIKK